MFKFVLRMMMTVVFVLDQMIVLMGVYDRVAVGTPVVGMYKGMLMNVNVVADNSIDDDKRSSRQHDGQSKQKPPGQLLMQDDKRQKRPDERRHRIISAGFRRTKNTLCPDIQKDAETVRHKTED